MSMFFMPQRGAAAADIETGSEVLDQDAVCEQPESDNVVSLNVQAVLGAGEPAKSPLRAFKASLDDTTTDAGSFSTRRPLVRLRRSAREGRLAALKSLRAKRAVGISDRRPEMIWSKELQR